VSSFPIHVSITRWFTIAPAASSCSIDSCNRQLPKNICPPSSLCTCDNRQGPQVQSRPSLHTTIGIIKSLQAGNMPEDNASSSCDHDTPDQGAAAWASGQWLGSLCKLACGLSWASRRCGFCEPDLLCCPRVAETRAGICSAVAEQQNSSCRWRHFGSPNPGNNKHTALACCPAGVSSGPAQLTSGCCCSGLGLWNVRSRGTTTAAHGALLTASASPSAF
jgi:hypothetical protein